VALVSDDDTEAASPEGRAGDIFGVPVPRLPLAPRMTEPPESRGYPRIGLFLAFRQIRLLQPFLCPAAFRISSCLCDRRRIDGATEKINDRRLGCSECDDRGQFD